MQDTITLPTVRVRIKHIHTMKDGWRCDETTVEITEPMERDAISPTLAQMLAAELYQAHQIGLEESTRRNHQEGRTT